VETTSAVFSTCTSQRKRLKTCRFDLFLCEVQVENTANFHEGRGRRTGNDPLSSHEMTLSGKYLWFYTFQAPIPDGFRENQLGKSAELVFQAPIPGSLRVGILIVNPNWSKLSRSGDVQPEIKLPWPFHQIDTFGC
jgi:hypothetical protein